MYWVEAVANGSISKPCTMGRWLSSGSNWRKQISAIVLRCIIKKKKGMRTLLCSQESFKWCEVKGRKLRNKICWGYFYRGLVCCLNSLLPDLASAKPYGPVHRGTNLFLSCVQDKCSSRYTLHNRPFHQLCHVHPAAIWQASEPLDQQRSCSRLSARRLGD